MERYFHDADRRRARATSIRLVWTRKVDVFLQEVFSRWLLLPFVARRNVETSPVCVRTACTTATTQGKYCQC
eukprot:GSA25T00018642001.1